MKSVARSLLITLSFGTVFAQASQAMFESDIFTYDDKENAKGLHVSLKGNKWQAKEVTEQDISFHQQLFSNPQVMAGFADGQIRTPESTEQRLRNMWIPRFQNGRPHGGLTVSDPETQENFGHVVAGGGDEAGVSEIAYSYLPAYWRKGIGSAVLGTIVQQWGPEVRRIGLGTGLDELQDANIIKAFKCFDGQELNRFDATASPSNPGSWKILEKFGFEAAASKVQNLEDTLDLDNKELQSPQALEEELLKLFDSSGDISYKIATRYRLIDTDGAVRTFSKHATYDRIKYHFERSVQ
jgi:RimJ/RimL family protein N-acetyltransferase